MGVDFFGTHPSPNNEGEMVVGYFFGSFLQAFLSLGQITTFDSWSSGIARDIIYAHGAGAALYFVIFIFVSGIIMMNVLVALLLDNYLQPSTTEIGPEEAVQKILSYVRNSELDLEKFVNYLNNKAFPDYLANYQKSDQPKTTGETPAVIEMKTASPFEGGCPSDSPPSVPPQKYDLSKVVSSLARIDNLVTLLEQSNEKLTGQIQPK